MFHLKPDRFDVGQFNEQPVSVCGKSFVADYSGALYWPAEKALIVADLHLEKGSAFAERGQMLPPYDTRETLIKLAAAIDRTSCETVICLGDSLHNIGGAERMGSADAETLAMLQEGREWIWLTGNHDPEIAARLGGHVFPELTVEGITLRHEPTAAPVTHEIAGHLHPAAKLSLNGHRLRRRCFVGNGRRLVLPAYGAFTGGLNILDDAFTPLFSNGGKQVWMLGQEGLYPVASRLLLDD
jgi:uncharacterized protein